MKIRWWSFKVTYENYFPINGVSHFTKILTYATDDIKKAEEIAKRDIEKLSITQLGIAKVELIGEEIESREVLEE